MKLSAALLRDKIIQQYPQAEIINLPDTLEFDRPFIYEPDLPAVSSVCLWDQWDILLEEKKLPEGSLFIFPCRFQEDTLGLRPILPCIFLGTTESLLHIFNWFQSLYDVYENWMHSLAHILLKNGSIQELLETSFPLFQNPLYIMGMDFTLTASCGLNILPYEHQVFHDSVRKIDYINAMKHDEYYNSVKDSEEPFLFPEHLTGIRSWNVNLRRLNHTTHRLAMLEYPHALMPSDSWLLQILASYAEHLLYQDTHAFNTSRNPVSSIFLTLLSDKTADYVAVSQRLSACGWSPGHQYLSLVLRIAFIDQTSLTSNAICSYIEELFPDSCCFTYKEDIVAFFNLTLLELTADTISRDLTYFIRDSFLKAGYSRTMKGHMNLRRQYVQACIALDVGCRKKPFIWIHHFDNIAMTYVLEQSRRQLPGYMLCHSGLLRLKEIDQSQNTDYFSTLRTYLDNHLNAVQSARDLFIHRSTFLYRLDKIKQILESDLESPEEILYLMFSYCLLEQEDNS